MYKLYHKLLTVIGYNRRNAELPTATSPLPSSLYPSEIAEQVAHFEGRLLFETVSDRDRAEIRDLKRSIDNMRLTLWAIAPEKALCPEEANMLRLHCNLRRLVLSEYVQPMQAEEIGDGLEASHVM
jgi:hypothetical protein